MKGIKEGQGKARVAWREEKGEINGDEGWTGTDERRWRGGSATNEHEVRRVKTEDR